MMKDIAFEYDYAWRDILGRKPDVVALREDRLTIFALAQKAGFKDPIEYALAARATNEKYVRVRRKTDQDLALEHAIRPPNTGRTTVAVLSALVAVSNTGERVALVCSHPEHVKRTLCSIARSVDMLNAVNLITVCDLSTRPRGCARVIYDI